MFEYRHRKLLKPRQESGPRRRAEKDSATATPSSACFKLIAICASVNFGLLMEFPRSSNQRIIGKLHFKIVEFPEGSLRFEAIDFRDSR